MECGEKMSKIKGWTKKSRSVNNWIGYYWKNDITGGVIDFEFVQDRDGKNAFIYTSICKTPIKGAFGVKLRKKVIATGRNELLVTKKTIDYMKKHPRG